MDQARDHVVTIERRTRSHRAVCVCGWESHAWTELRPAEADAWHHAFGDAAVVDVSQQSQAAPERHTPTQAPEARPQDMEQLVRTARELAGGPSPYSRNTSVELWDAAGRDADAVHKAVAEVEALLATHERKSLGTADGEWLDLMTAKRLLLHALGVNDQSASPRGRR